MSRSGIEPTSTKSESAINVGSCSRRSSEKQRAKLTASARSTSRGPRTCLSCVAPSDCRIPPHGRPGSYSRCHVKRRGAAASIAFSCSRTLPRVRRLAFVTPAPSRCATLAAGCGRRWKWRSNTGEPHSLEDACRPSAGTTAAAAIVSRNSRLSITTQSRFGWRLERDLDVLREEVAPEEPVVASGNLPIRRLEPFLLHELRRASRSALARCRSCLRRASRTSRRQL